LDAGFGFGVVGGAWHALSCGGFVGGGDVVFEVVSFIAYYTVIITNACSA